MTGVCALACSRVPNGLVAHPVHRGQLVGTQRTRKYFGDLLITQATQRSTATDPTALQRLSHVLCVRTGRQMLGLHADRSVTAVQNMQSRRYGSVEDVVTDPVGVGAAMNAAIDPAIPVALLVTAPIPAPIGRWRLWHNPLKLLLGRKTMRYGHWQSLLWKHAILRFRHLDHLLTVSCKRSMVNG